MKRWVWLFVLVLGVAVVAWGKPSDDNTADEGPTGDGAAAAEANEPVDGNGVQYSATSTSDPNAVITYDDSNIHDVWDIINPIRLRADNSGATQSLVERSTSAEPTLTSVTVTPTSARSSDQIVVTFGGRKGSHYVVSRKDVVVDGTRIMLDTFWIRDAVLDGPIVDYSLTQSLGTLNAGTYTLQVRNYYGGRVCATRAMFFTVTASAAGIDLDSLSDLLGGGFTFPHTGAFENWPQFDLLD